MGTDRPYETSPELTGLSLAYRNTDYIADKVLPRIPVTKTCFQYRKYATDAFLTIPNTELGRTGMPNQMSIKSTLELAEVTPHGLEGEVPQADIEEMQATDGSIDLLADKITQVTDGLALAREVRVANLLADVDNYNGNVITLSGEDQLSDKASSVIDVFKDVKKMMLMYPTHAVVSDTYALYLQTHPDFLGLFKSDGDNKRGIVPLEFIAQQLGLKEILVGRAKVNSAKQGQTAKIVEVWGNDLLFIHQNQLTNTRDGMSFGYTAEKGKREVQTYFNGRPGARGVHYVKAVEEVGELITATSCGCLIKNAFAQA